MDKLYMINEGKSKEVYGDGRDVILKFKGDVRCSSQKTQFDFRIARARVLFTYKTYEYLSQRLDNVLMPELIDETTIKMKRVIPLPLEWIPRFVAAGSVVKRFEFVKGHVFKKPILKIDYKTDVDDYLITDELIVEKGILSEIELTDAKRTSMQIAHCLRDFFLEKNLSLWDFKMELGKSDDGKIVLMDEISLDGIGPVSRFSTK